MGPIHVKATRDSDVVTELFLWFSGELCRLFWQHSRYSSCRYFLQTIVTVLLELKGTFLFHAAEPLFQSVAKSVKKVNPIFYGNRDFTAKNHTQDLRPILILVKTVHFTSSLKPILILSPTVYLVDIFLKVSQLELPYTCNASTQIKIL